MKKYVLFFTTTLSFFSVSSIAQQNGLLPATAKWSNNDVAMADTGLKVVSYHVEERINKPLGSSITTYDVPSLSMINTNDLGPNNSRVVTPKYERNKSSVVTVAEPKASVTKLEIPVKKVEVPVVKSVKVEAPAKEKDNFVNIDIVSTYERVLDKGYKSVDMLKKVADRRYFDGDLVTAAKWYTQLLELTSDLDAVYYYPYAQALKAVNQPDKAAEMMAIFNKKNQ